MSMPAQESSSREAPAPPEPARRVAPRRATADRRLRILERLTTGLTVAHIAREEGLSVQRIRRIIAEMLESREIDPPAGFVQLQIARLSEAMIVARTMMMEGDLHAMDRLIKLTGELDRYHGFAPAQIPWAREAAPPRLAAPEPRAILPSRGVSLAGIAAREGLTAKRSRPEMAPQRLEKIESAPGNGMVSEALDPQQHVVHGRAANRARLRLASRENDEAIFSVSQSIEIARNRIGISEASPARRTERRSSRAASPAPARRREWRRRPSRPGKLQKKAPKVLKSFDAKLKSAPAPEEANPSLVVRRVIQNEVL